MDIPYRVIMDDEPDIIKMERTKKSVGIDNNAKADNKDD